MAEKTWLGGILGSLFGGDDTNPTPSPTTNDTFFTPSFFGDIIKAGAGLAGTYFALDQNKDFNTQQIAQAQAANAFAHEQLDAQKAEAGGKIKAMIKVAEIQAAAMKKVAKMNNLGALYQNWGSLTERGGESAAQSAQATGKLMEDPIISRVGALR